MLTNVAMPVTLNHLAIPARDAEATAAFLSDLLDLPVERDGADDDPEAPANGEVTDPLGGSGRVYSSTGTLTHSKSASDGPGSPASER
jgi:catechol 2,3-dioxygenase-like lactoylglutathione lyase family enzyme